MSPPRREGSPLRTARPFSGKSDNPSRQMKAPQVTFDEEGIRRQGQEAEARKTALRPAERAGSPVKEEPVTAGPKAENPAPRGGYWKRRKEKWKQQAAQKGQGRGKKGGSGHVAEARQVQMK